VFYRRRLADPWWWGGLTLLFALLSFGQVVTFGLLLGACAIAGSLVNGRPSWNAAWRFAVWMLSVLLIARALHGFFAPSLEPTGLHLDFRPFLLSKPTSEVFLWHAASL
jgi:hypothetical protein